MKSRNHAFDFLCGLCILRMMTLHVISFTGHQQEEWWKTVMAWSFFFMCFFFFKAGYFNKTVSGNSREFILDKAKRLLIPYFIWGAIGATVYFAFIPFEMQKFGHTIEKMEWSHLWMTSSFWGNEPTWFLFSFFMAYVVTHFMKKIHFVKPISVFQSVIVISFPFISYWLFKLDNPLWYRLNNVFMGVFFFYLGRGWKWVLEKLSRRNAILICSVLVSIFCYMNIKYHGEYVMSQNIFRGDGIAAIFNTIIILLGLSGLLIKLPLPRIPVINYFGEHSMVYFVAHYPIIHFYKLTHICFGRSIYHRWDEMIILWIMMMCICTWLVPYVEKVPWLSGRWPKKKVVQVGG